MKKYIVHSELKNPNVVLFASDMVGQKTLLKGNSVSLALNCRSEKELKKYYKSLSTDGEQTHPPEETYWGAVFGSLKDKFGINWLLNYQRKSKKKILTCSAFSFVVKIKTGLELRDSTSR
jgi:PhnB protein